MSKLIIVVFSLLGLISECVGQTEVIQNGQCDNSVPVVANFDGTRYLGDWYDIESLPTNFQTGTCNKATYSANPDGSLNVFNTEVVSGVLKYVTGTAVPTAPAKFEVSISGAPPVPYWILGTDYTTYALVYSCRNINSNQRQVNSWKLGRNKGPLPTDAANAINRIIASVAALNEASDRYIPGIHTAEACSYFVDFEGPCPTTVTGVPDFDIPRYLGTWYEVARYPQTTQNGQCSRAQYALGDSGSVTVENSEVVDETLSTMIGTATAVTGQSGVLQVTFTVDGVVVNQNLHVLATDYDTYALVYSCANLGGNRRRIGSWKMSKSNNQLDQTAINNINAAISATPDLAEAYYQETSQTDAACFHYPDFESPPSVIELPGPCDTSITGVANFDVNRFLGTWYEVARYPQWPQIGQCTRTQYTLEATGSITVKNTQVHNEALLTRLGTATAVTGQSGVLQVTFTIIDEPINQNLYVLATDYDNYALLYGCTNIAGNSRRVRSWKLSKSNNPLSVEANNAINNVITATQGLREEYYQETSQTDDACWHYLPQNGPKVIIPGQCDTSISGVANIDLTAFANSTWYQIHRYDAVGESTCVGSRLSYDDGNININSIELVRGQAKKTEGVAQLTAADRGKFTLKMADSEEQEEIYILATDYHGYAIAYSCKNNGTDNRQIGAWQLSRGRSMPEASFAALDKLVAERREFTRAETYFKTIPQRGNCPEPSSAFLFKSSIIVIFVCTLLQLVW